MLPVVAIVGRPNVGKSTLFNRLTRTKDALITEYAGTTRDRQYGTVNLDDRHFIIIDTGGLTEEQDAVGKLIAQQAQLAISDADQIIFVIDARAGVTPEDRLIADYLRKIAKPIVLTVNKTEGLNPDLSITEAYELGMGEPVAIAATHGMGTEALLDQLFPKEPIESNFDDTAETDEVDVQHEAIDTSIKLAIVGRPNVGKSTLTNRMLGEERVIVHDSPGTTRDSIFIPLTRFDQSYTLIDTAGVRKRKKVADLPEKFSIVKTLQAIEDAHVVLYVLDANLGVAEQDLKLLGFVLEAGKGLVIAVNKWDGLSEAVRERAKASLDRQLDFVRYAKIHFISALHGTGVGNLFASVDQAYESANRKLSTPELTRLLQQAIETHQPPLVQGRRVKLRYAHAGGHNPPRVIIHGNQLHALPDSYKRFLASFFQNKLNLVGTPVQIIFKSNKNPYDS